jgi:hypothetical protein
MKRILDKLAFFLLGYGYVFTLLYLIASMFYQNIPVLFILWISFASYLVACLFLSFKVSRIIFYCLAGLSAIGVGVLYLEEKADFITRQIFGIGIIFEKVYFNEPIVEEILLPFLTVFMVASAVLVAIAVFILFYKAFDFFILCGVTIGTQLFAWVMTGKENQTVFIISCVLLILSYIRHVYEKKLKKGLAADQKASGSLMLFSIPLALIPVLLISWMPKSETPIQWPWLDEKILKVMQYIEERFNNTNIEIFSLSATGFDGRSQRLGGPIRPSNTAVMDVKSSKRTYLRGAAYTWYEDSTWSVMDDYARDISMADENNMEVNETRTGWVNIPVEDMFNGVNQSDLDLLRGMRDGKFQAFLFPTYDLSIHYRKMSTRSVFTPLKTIMPVKNDRGGDMTVEENLHGIALSESMITSSDDYILRYLQPMYGEPMLKQALTFSRRNLYKDALDIVNLKRKALIRKAAEAKQAGDDEDPADLQDDGVSEAGDRAGTASDGATGDGASGSAGDAISGSEGDGTSGSEEDATSNMTGEDADNVAGEEAADSTIQDQGNTAGEEDSEPASDDEASDTDPEETLETLTLKADALNALYARAQTIENIYTRVCDTIPQRVIDLALEITKDCDNDYEKVVAIESYLRTNYTYTLSPSRLPADRDFVDYFLFDERRGYCTYYATSMVILTRLNGIPARYVEGYVLPEEPVATGLYTVTNQQAHAWVEVYFEGFGWLTFEPTSIYADAMNYRAILPTGGYTDYSYYMEDYMAQYAQEGSRGGFEPIQPIQAVKKDLMDYVQYGLVVLAVIAVAFYLINLMAELIGIIIMSRLKRKNKVLKLYKMMLKWLATIGYTVKDGETAIEFGKRMDSLFSFPADTFENTSRTFSQVRYGNIDVELEKLKDMQIVAKYLRRQILRDLGLKRYLPLRRIILGL